MRCFACPDVFLGVWEFSRKLGWFEMELPLLVVGNKIPT